MAAPYGRCWVRHPNFLVSPFHKPGIANMRENPAMENTIIILITALSGCVTSFALLCWLE